jgi:hypothetical protein
VELGVNLEGLVGTGAEHLPDALLELRLGPVALFLVLGLGALIAAQAPAAAHLSGYRAVKSSVMNPPPDHPSR